MTGIEINKIKKLWRMTSSSLNMELVLKAITSYILISYLG